MAFDPARATAAYIDSLGPEALAKAAAPPVQEFIFYSHPSVETRVRRAMEWKAAHPSPPAPPADTDGPNMRGPAAETTGQ